MPRRIVFLFLFFLLAKGLFAQTQKIAALRENERQARDQRGKLEQELLLLEAHESLYKDSLMPLAKRALANAEILADKAGKGNAKIGLIHAYLRADNANTADSLIKISIPQYPLADRALADIHLKLLLEQTNILASRADYEGAVKELFTTIKEGEQTQNFAVLSRAFNELGVISYNRDDLAKAMEYDRKALSFNDQNPQREEATAYAYINIAMVHGWQEHFDSALHYLALAKPICERLQNLYYLANVYVVEANVYKWSHRLPQAEAAMLQMVALREKTEGSITFSNEQLGLANFYVYAKEYDKAIAIYKSGLAYSQERRVAGISTNYEFVLHYYEGLAKSYRAKNARDEYEDALQQIVAYKDSLKEKNSADAIAEMQTRYEVQKKETTIIAQKLDITRKNILFYGSLVLLFVASLIGWLLFRNYKRRSEMQLFITQQEDKRREAEAVREAEEAERRRIASDLHDNLGSYAASIKSNADELRKSQEHAPSVLELLQTNAQQMVSLLSDTIWAMRKPAMKLSDISDRIKLVLQRLGNNYPLIRMRVVEALSEDNELMPAQAYHLFMIVQEAINNAVRHSGCNELVVHINGGQCWSVTVADNGKGMPTEQGPTEGGNGIANMKQRAENIGCNISWQQAANGGTKVVVQANPF